MIPRFENSRYFVVKTMKKQDFAAKTEAPPQFAQYRNGISKT